MTVCKVASYNDKMRNFNFQSIHHTDYNGKCIDPEHKDRDTCSCKQTLIILIGFN